MYCLGSLLIYWRISLILAKYHWGFPGVPVGLPLSRAVVVLFFGFPFMSSNLILACMVSRTAILAFTGSHPRPCCLVLFACTEVFKGKSDTFHTMCSPLLFCNCPLSSIFFSPSLVWSLFHPADFSSLLDLHFPVMWMVENPSWMWNPSCVSFP